jgi:hypothetical protein
MGGRIQPCTRFLRAGVPAVGSVKPGTHQDGDEDEYNDNEGSQHLGAIQRGLQPSSLEHLDGALCSHRSGLIVLPRNTKHRARCSVTTSAYRRRPFTRQESNYSGADIRLSRYTRLWRFPLGGDDLCNGSDSLRWALDSRVGVVVGVVETRSTAAARLFSAVCGTFRSEPPRTRTWNLEIKSLRRRVSGRCSRLQSPLVHAILPVLA